MLFLCCVRSRYPESIYLSTKLQGIVTPNIVIFLGHPETNLFLSCVRLRYPEIIYLSTKLQGTFTPNIVIFLVYEEKKWGQSIQYTLYSISKFYSQV